MVAVVDCLLIAVVGADVVVAAAAFVSWVCFFAQLVPPGLQLVEFDVVDSEYSESGEERKSTF